MCVYLYANTRIYVYIYWVQVIHCDYICIHVTILRILSNPAHLQKLTGHSGISPYSRRPSNPSSFSLGWFGFRINVKVWMFLQAIANVQWSRMMVHSDCSETESTLEILIVDNTGLEPFTRRFTVSPIISANHTYCLIDSSWWLVLWLDITCRTDL